MRMFYFNCAAKSFRILRSIGRKNKWSHWRFPGSGLAHQQDLSCGISTLTFSGKRAQRVQFLEASHTLRFIVSYKLLFLSRSSSYTIVQTQIFCVTTRNTFFFPYALLFATRFPGNLFLQRKINFYFRTSFLPGDVGWRKARDVHVDQEVTGKRVASKAATQIDVGL